MMNLLGAEGESGAAYIEGMSEILAEKKRFFTGMEKRKPVHFERWDTSR